MEEEMKNSELELSEDVVVEETTTAEDLHGENLGDRVKVLSPGRMVAKRFFRSRLSMVGLVTLLLFVAHIYKLLRSFHTKGLLHHTQL